MLENWHYVYTISIAMVIYVNYILFRSKLTDYETTGQPHIKSSYVYYETPASLPQCCNALHCSIEGNWYMRTDLKHDDFDVIDKTNMDLRIKKGWPYNLYHGDMRCGPKYPLPRMLRNNNSKVHILDIRSQCKPFSKHPCCREDIGWCGRDEMFCNCKSCINYNNPIYAELSNWIPSNNCKVRTLYSNDTCWFLQKHYSSITFIGDSLVRHIFSSLLIHLTEDRTYGALKSNQSRKVLEFCKEESQFVDSSCHTRLATKWDDIKNNKRYCASMREKIKISFTQAYNIANTELAISAIKEALSQENALILIGIGVHEQFNVMGVINEYLNPIIELINENKETQSKIIWFNTHAAGYLKPLTFQKTQGNDRIIVFNKQLREFCHRNNIDVFDMYNITADVHSFDGTHYGSVVNALKVRLLIDGLVSLKEAEQLQPRA